MQRSIRWLQKHRTINILLMAGYFLAVVSLHDAVTELAIKLRRSMSVEGYNMFFTVASGVLFLLWISWIFRNVTRSKAYRAALFYFVPTFLLIVLFFGYMMTYSIEAVHFFQYAILAAMLFPLTGSYGASVFYATILGIFDEVFQYLFLTPTFKYFDLNDIILNLLGAGLACVTIYLVTGIRTKPEVLKKQLILVLTVIAVFAVSYAVCWFSGLIRWYPQEGGEAPLWFTISRSLPESTFWTEAYNGRFFHIIRPWEGISLMMVFLAYFFAPDIREQKYP